VRIIVADDEYVGVPVEEWRRLTGILTDLNVTYLQLLPRTGLSAGRNALVESCTTKYLVILDDDVFFGAATRLDTMLAVLEAKPDIQLVAGAYAQYNSYEGATAVNDYSLLFEQTSAARKTWRAYAPPDAFDPEGSATAGCRRVHAAHNFFMARTETLRRYPWHQQLAIFEHEHFFLKLFLANQKVLACPRISVFHQRAPNMPDQKYRDNSMRFKEHLFARHFCTSFVKEVRRFDAPYWSYDCVNYLLCPRWKNTTFCTPMVDTSELVDGAIKTKAASLGPSFGEVRRSRVKDTERLPYLPESTHRPVPVPIIDPEPLLVVGEAGSGAGLVSQLFVHAVSDYMLWQEPKYWRWSSHLSDDLFGELLARLFDCALSSEQLAMLHVNAPYYTPDDPLNSDVDAGQLQFEEMDDTGDPIRAGSFKSARLASMMATTIKTLGSLYTEKGINSTEPRFCAPGTASIVTSTRFEQGLPKALQKVPIKVMLMVRNPIDIVIARLQAKWQRRVPLWPACTPHSVDRCADLVCGSIERTLDSVPAPASDRLRILRWEQFTYRKQRSLTDLFAWVGANYSSSALNEILELADSNIKGFHSLSDKYPLEPRSKAMVTARCSKVMARLGYDVGPDDAALKPSKPSSVDAFGKKRWRSKTNSTSRASAEPLLLLRHTYDPSFTWCPVRLAASETIFKLFVRLDTPRASTAPPCHATSVNDRCPYSSRLTKRQVRWSRRWGAYPFEVVDGAAELRRNKRSRRKSHSEIILPGFSVAIVRNPWERLAAAYQRYVEVQDKGGFKMKAWIREYHRMGEKDPVTFTHFVRWVVQQQGPRMASYWRPYSEVCRFSTIKYDFVGRVETLQEDLERLMSTLKMNSVQERMTLVGVLSRTNPAVPMGSADRLLKLMHYYLADDNYDLVGMVRDRYRDDIERFGYQFNANSTVSLW